MDRSLAARSSFVLVHGAFVNAACWDKVAARLREAGATVATPHLPAAEHDDPTLAGTTTMADYVAAMERVIDTAPKPVILVGHSMGGMVVSQLAEARAEDLAAVVYLSAYYPQDGEKLLDLAGTDAGSALGKALNVDQARGICSLSDEAMRAAFFNDTSAADTETGLRSKRTQPLQPFVAPVHLTEGAYGSVPRYYIGTRNDRAVTYDLQERMLARRPVVKHVVIDGDHASMISHDATVASTLQDFASGGG